MFTTNGLLEQLQQVQKNKKIVTQVKDKKGNVWIMDADFVELDKFCVLSLSHPLLTELPKVIIVGDKENG